jgi:hypothetical protein
MCLVKLKFANNLNGTLVLINRWCCCRLCGIVNWLEKLSCLLVLENNYVDSLSKTSCNLLPSCYRCGVAVGSFVMLSCIEKLSCVLVI